MTRNVGIYIFDEIEVLDLGGPFEVFSTASRMKARLHPGAAKPFEVFTCAETLRPVRARGGLLVQPAFDLTNHRAIDVFIVPGGVVTAELKRDNVIEWITRTAAKASLTASVCTGAFLLAKAGLLRGKTITHIGRTSRTSVRCFRTSRCETTRAGWTPGRSSRPLASPPVST